MTTLRTNFFVCRGYALAAVGALVWAARAQEENTADAKVARAWTLGEPTEGRSPTALSFDLCVQAVGLSSRREQLRESFIARPQEGLARLLSIAQSLGGDDSSLPGDTVDATLRMMRSYHLDAGSPSFSPRGAPGSEPAC